MKTKTKAAKTTKAAVKKVAAKKPGMDDTNYRVHYFSKELRLAARAAREKEGVTQAVQLESAVDRFLPGIVADLAAVGITQPKNVGPTRLPLSDSLLKQLREASNTSGLPMATLLAACLTLSSGTKGKKGSK